MAAIYPHIDLTQRNLHAAVYYKKAWTSPWQPAPYFEPLAATLAAAPTISTASFRTHYGCEGFWEDKQEMADASVLEPYIYCYIQIRVRRGSDEIILWTGVVPTETFYLLGQSSLGKTADHIIQAQGLEILLKNRLDGAWVKPVGGSIEDKKWIGHIPPFNQRHEFGGNIIGNRSSVMTEELTHIFAEDGVPWDNLTITNHLLKYYQYENGPNFYLKGETEIIEALGGIIEVYDFSQRTVLDALNILISRNRGFGWVVSVSENDLVNIVPFSLLDENISLGDIVMPANSKKISLDLWLERMLGNVEITNDTAHVYDRIIVRGARMKSCCSLSFADSSLEKGWTDAEETAFKAAASETEGYDALDDDEKAELNDKFRAEDRFERVFTTFRVPRDWDWKVNAGEVQDIVNPLLDSTGELHTDEQAAYWNSDKRFANSLPFKVGFDYSGAEPVDNNPASAEPEFRRLFVLVEQTAGKHQYVEKLKPARADVRPLTREMAVSMGFNPRYLAAKNHWEGAEPGNWSDDIEEFGIDYEDIIVTAFLETDQVVQVEQVFYYGENQRTLIITIPDAELWYIVPGTIIGIDENGSLIPYGGTSNLLRDDRDRLRRALNAAVAWYGRQRNKAAITIKSIDPGIPIGTMIENIDVSAIGAAGSAVTSLHWDFQGRPASTTIATDFGELDIAEIFYQKRLIESGFHRAK